MKPRDLWTGEDWLDYLEGWTLGKFPDYQIKRDPGRMTIWKTKEPALGSLNYPFDDVKEHVCKASLIQNVGIAEALAQRKAA
jgi:hypothetical protein